MKIKNSLLGSALSLAITASVLSNPATSFAAVTVQASADLTPVDVTTIKGGPEAQPDYSSQLDLMRSLSYQISSKGTAHAKSWVYGMRRDAEKLYDSYRDARIASRKAHMDAQSTRNAPRLSGWADCGGYVATVVKNTVDPYFPWLLTNVQKSYLENTANGWEKVGDTRDYRPQDYKPGDVMVTNGHIMFWVGDWDGFSEVVNDASFSRNEEKLTGRMPGFRQAGFTQGNSLLNPGTPAVVDSRGRDYDVYRFKGRVSNAVGMTDWAGVKAGAQKFDGTADLLAVTSAGVLRYYEGAGDGGAFKPYERIGTKTYKNHQIITPGDFDRDGYQDIISVDNQTGEMFLEGGKGNGKLKDPKRIGKGIGSIRDLTSVGDFDGDGKADLVGITKNDGRMLLWRGNGKGGWLPRKQIGSGFKNLRIASGGDFDGDGLPDIVSWSESNATMLLHRSNGKGGWLNRKALAPKTNQPLNVLVQSVGDLDEDGYSDLLVIDKKTGELVKHQGNKKSVFNDGEVIGKTWQHMRSIS